jgi:type I restriction enzyme S subunit
MTKRWPIVRLGQVLRRVERFESRDELTEYQFAGTYSFARGIFVGQRKLGSTFALPKIQRVREGDFVYCKIMAWEGAFGIVPKDADNCVLSGAFVVYELNRQRIDQHFLDYFFKVPAHWQSIGSQSTGTNVRRQSLHPAQFEKAEIPLPPLAEQRRVVARIEELAAQIHEARTLRHQAAEEAEALPRSILSHDEEAKPTPMRELVKLRPPDVTVRADETYQFAGAYCFGRGVFKGARKSGMDFAYSRLTRLRAGEFVYPKLMAWEGALGIVPPECDGCVVWIFREFSGWLG